MNKLSEVFSIALSVLSMVALTSCGSEDNTENMMSAGASSGISIPAGPAVNHPDTEVPLLDTAVVKDASEVAAEEVEWNGENLLDRVDEDGYLEVRWDELVPQEYRPEAVIAKYQEELADLEDSDPRALEIYDQIMAELDNAPVNEELHGKKIKLAGFIAPLENTDGKVSDFLLVPYFGACIHVPPPPVNQIVMVEAAKGESIDADESYNPFWIKGTLTTKGKATDIGTAGYSIEQATTELYE